MCAAIVVVTPLSVFGPGDFAHNPCENTQAIEAPMSDPSVSSLQAELSQLKDNIALQLHLGRKDAKALWDKLNPAMSKMESDLRAVGSELQQKSDEARLQAHLGLAALKRRWPSVESGLAELIHDLHGAAAGAETKLDAARVQAHLANMDADDKAAAALSAVRAAAAELDAQSAAVAAELQARVRSLRERLSPSK
jgi:hypothetical protein